MIEYDDSLGNPNEYEIPKHRMVEFKKYLKDNGINNYKKIISNRNDTFIWITDYLKLNNLCKDTEYVDYYNNGTLLNVAIVDNNNFNSYRDYIFDETEYRSLLLFINNIETYKSTTKFNI
jgi:hypothetical protein